MVIKLSKEAKIRKFLPVVDDRLQDTHQQVGGQRSFVSLVKKNHLKKVYSLMFRCEVLQLKKSEIVL